jgi:hypothetical protein
MPIFVRAFRGRERWRADELRACVADFPTGVLASGVRVRDVQDAIGQVDLRPCLRLLPFTTLAAIRSTPWPRSGIAADHARLVMALLAESVDDGGR